MPLGREVSIINDNLSPGRGEAISNPVNRLSGRINCNPNYRIIAVS
jgi:hypothetical protein